jgi:ABC-type glutathione transport system ATPase component
VTLYEELPVRHRDQLRILVVDDEANTAVISVALRLSGLSGETAAPGRDASVQTRSWCMMALPPRRHPRPVPRSRRLAAAAAPKPTTPSEPVTELVNVRKTYEIGDIAAHALRGVTLAVRRGEYVAIMRRLAAGKSTMMNIMAALTFRRAAVRLNGRDVKEVGEDELAEARNREIGFVFQSFDLIPRTRDRRKC